MNLLDFIDVEEPIMVIEGELDVEGRLLRSVKRKDLIGMQFQFGNKPYEISGYSAPDHAELRKGDWVTLLLKDVRS